MPGRILALLPVIGRQNVQAKPYKAFSPTKIINTSRSHQNQNLFNVQNSTFQEFIRDNQDLGIEQLPSKIISELEISSLLEQEQQLQVFPQLSIYSELNMKIKQSISELKNKIVIHKKMSKLMKFHVKHIDGLLQDQRKLLENKGYFVTFYKNQIKAKLDYQEILTKMYQ